MRLSGRSQLPDSTTVSLDCRLMGLVAAYAPGACSHPAYMSGTCPLCCRSSLSARPAVTSLSLQRLVCVAAAACSTDMHLPHHHRDLRYLSKPPKSHSCAVATSWVCSTVVDSASLSGGLVCVSLQNQVWATTYTKAQGICALPEKQWSCFVPDYKERWGWFGAWLCYLCSLVHTKVSCRLCVVWNVLSCVVVPWVVHLQVLL
jgi:hypothetical protein